VAESGDFLHGVVVEMLRDTPRREITDERELLRWLTAVARNNIRDEVRRAREDVLQRLSTSLDVRGGRPGSEERPSRLLVQAEAAERLISALEKLDESDRRVIELRDFEDLSWSEVARALDRSEESARKLHGRALVRLGRGLKQA
jgi:RNA polymerase sigma factor (sigma-70 family)